MKTIVKEWRNFELAHLKKKKKKEEREHFGAFGDFLVRLPQCFFMPRVAIVGHETLILISVMYWLLT